jgi:hypothetical protein
MSYIEKSYTTLWRNSWPYIEKLSEMWQCYVFVAFKRIRGRVKFLIRKKMFCGYKRIRIRADRAHFPFSMKIMKICDIYEQFLLMLIHTFFILPKMLYAFYCSIRSKPNWCEFLVYSIHQNFNVCSFSTYIFDRKWTAVRFQAPIWTAGARLYN